MAKLGQQLDFSQTEAIVCEECGGNVFTEALMLQKVPAILTGTGKDGIVPIPTFRCCKCGHINAEFLPQEVKTNGSN